MAKLHYIYGCMGSSKSLRLLALAHNLLEKGVEFVIFKPAKDTRESEDVVKSRAGLEMKCLVIDDDTDVYQFIKTYKERLSLQMNSVLRWVFIDECQFLEPKQVDQLTDVVDKLDVNVMCYGLRTDFTSKLFPASKRLFELADELEEIKSYCTCGKHRASINARFDSDGKLVTSGSQIMVGGDDRYTSLCRGCYKKLLKESQKEE